MRSSRSGNSQASKRAATLVHTSNSHFHVQVTGAIMEREQSYKDAAEHYEKAWKHENQASAQV